MGAMTLNVRVSGLLGNHVANNIGEDGLYENVSEYVRDLIRQDKARLDEGRLDTLKAELRTAFAAPESDSVPFVADEFLARMKSRRK